MTSRRQKYAEETRQALITSSRQLFGEQGYAQTSLDGIAHTANVTKGAIYHHFKNKEAIFEAVVVQLLEETIQLIIEGVEKIPDPIQRTITALDLALDLGLTPDYQRIVLQDAPSVLGWERWKQLEKQFSYGLIRNLLHQLSAKQAQPDEITVRLIMSCVIEVALMVTEAETPAEQQKVREQGKITLLNFIQSIA
jgi:AcrR family transcriptional regulator